MTHFLLSSLLLTATTFLGVDSLQADNTPVVEVAPTPVVDLAICLDTSGSMDGLIDAARRNIWAIVNDLAMADPTPELRIAFLTFGNDGHDEASGWVKVHAPLTGDVDLISQELFAQTTNGGTELVARVIDTAVRELEWSDANSSLKIIVVAGNEGADQDTQVAYQDACRDAIAKGIMVNAIYCGNEADTDAPAWREVSLLADGSFAWIDQDEAIVDIPTPFDDELSTLSSSINTTYVRYGAAGSSGGDRQWAEDANVVALGAGVVAQRCSTKASSLYLNSSWDLVDACRESVVDLESIEEEVLPEEMKEMTAQERKAYIDSKQAQRTALSDQVADLTSKRQVFLATERAKLAEDDSNTFSVALRAAIRKQAAEKGINLPADPEPTVTEIDTDATDPGDGDTTES
jgi:hypothetical protein